MVEKGATDLEEGLAWAEESEHTDTVIFLEDKIEEKEREIFPRQETPKHDPNDLRCRVLPPVLPLPLEQILQNK